MADDDFENRPCFFNGKFIPLKEANVNIRTHALQYGTAVFGGIRGYYNEDLKNLFIFRLFDHYQRLENSARIMQMKLPFSPEKLCEINIELLNKGGWRENVYLRPFLYKNELSLSPRLHNVKDDFALYAIPLNDYLDVENGLRAAVSSWVRISENQIPTRAKATGGYVNSALAKSEAIQNGFDEAIFLDHLGFVSEGSAENIFLVKEGQLITPEITSSVLEGITRRSIIELAQDLGIEVMQRKVARSELYTCDEIFFCGTGVQIAWIKEIDHRVIGTGRIGEITRSIRDLFFEIVKGNNKKYINWLTPVYKQIP